MIPKEWQNPISGSGRGDRTWNQLPHQTRILALITQRAMPVAPAGTS
jgi:hypothetical protein